MFSALKKLTKTSDGSNHNAGNSSNVQPMASSFQRKFARGVQYNMKIVIKGDRNVGKSCLLERLQGKGFIESYTPTNEIQVAPIQWSFKATEDIVKVEVWDVVDKGKPKVKLPGLKMSSDKPAIPEMPALDAEFLDVYKGTHGVILMMDITKAWTFDYVCNELPKIPEELPVLVLGNHCDMSHHRIVSTGQAISLVESYEQRPGKVLYGESSMRNGFGLRLLHKFLGLPFLRLQHDSLVAQLERNTRDAGICLFEITEFLGSDEANYDMFLDNLSDRRRKQAESHAAKPSTVNYPPLTNNGVPFQPTQSMPPIQPVKSIIVGGGKPIVPLNQRSNREMVSKMPPAEICQEALEICERSVQSTNKNLSLDEFCPDSGGLDKSFFDDMVANANALSLGDRQNTADSESDEEGDNPLVATFHEEPDATVDNDFHCDQPKTVKQPKENPLAKNSIRSGVPGNNSDTAEEFDTWLQRGSPEGGEDVSPVNHNTADEETEEKPKKKKKEKKEHSSSKHGDKTKKKNKKSKSRHSGEFTSDTTDNQLSPDSYEVI